MSLKDDAIKRANEAAAKARTAAAKKKSAEAGKSDKLAKEKDSIDLQTFEKDLGTKIQEAGVTVKNQGKTKTIGSPELGFHKIVEGEQSSTFLYALIEVEEWVKGTKLSSPIISTYRLGDWLNFLSHGEGQQWTIQGVLHVPSSWGKEVPLSYDEFFDAQAKEAEKRRQMEEKIRNARANASDKPRERVFMK
jgi:hypothetical protein